MKYFNQLDLEYLNFYSENLKNPNYIIMNKKTFDNLLLKIQSIYNIEKPASGKFFYRGIEIIIKNEVLTNKFIII